MARTLALNADPRSRWGRAIAVASVSVALLALSSLAGCQRNVNMATAQSASWKPTTIPYAGVREANRKYPDYSIINASILTSAAPAAPKSPSRKP